MLKEVLWILCLSNVYEPKELTKNFDSIGNSNLSIKNRRDFNYIRKYYLFTDDIPILSEDEKSIYNAITLTLIHCTIIY